MNTHVRIENGEIAEYPYSLYQLRHQHPATAFPAQPSPPDLAAFGVFEVIDTPRPERDPITQDVVERTPVLDGDEWRRVWEVVAVPPEVAEQRLADAKAELRARINAERDAREEGGFDYLGERIDSGSRSVQRIGVAVTAAQTAMATGAPFALDWTCADNSVLTMDATEVVGMSVALAVYGDSLHQYARVLKAAVSVAETGAQLAQIDITAGWPPED
ncbi:MAG: DUF4376 domain-containing protein [Trueperaceae bacterium]